MTTSARALMPDYLRLIALFGIVVVNVQYIAFSALQGFAESAAETSMDAITLWLVHGLALLKTYGLFAFMFGVGLGFMMRSAAQRGLHFGRLYRNCMIGLLLLGIAHGCLFFPGDILVIYAVAGAFLYLFRDWTVRRLVRTGAILILVQTVIALPLLLATPETPADTVALERTILTQGGYVETILYRSIGFAFVMPTFLAIQGVSALGWFCLGLASVKSGMIDDAGHPLWRRARLMCLIPGVALSLLGAAIWQWGPMLHGAVLTIVIAPLATLGYLGLIAAISRPPGPFMGRALAAGGSSLSIYLGQSILLSTVFSGYGLGLWDDLGRMSAVGIAVAVTFALIVILALWHTKFSLGPFEWCLRRITYAHSIRRAD